MRSEEEDEEDEEDEEETGNDNIENRYILILL